MANRIAIIGAGIAGLACAGELSRAGHDVALFDKGRRPGGRVATRRTDGMLFDHGAQYATARGRLAEVMATLQTAGRATLWPAAGTDEPRWIGTPGMSAIAQGLADALPAGAVRPARHAAFLRHDETGWWLRHLPADQTPPGTVREDGDHAGPFDSVALALPSPQAVPLLAAMGHAFHDRVAATAYDPCWTVMAAFAAPVAGPDIHRPAGSPIGWAGRDSARPGRPPGPDGWVLQADAAWSRDNLERPADAVAAELSAAFIALTGTASPTHLSAHRWRYARVSVALGEPCLWDAETGLGLCGDWCLGPRIEAAYESGLALAQAIKRRP